jgi:hypothetical protein
MQGWINQTKMGFVNIEYQVKSQFMLSNNIINLSCDLPKEIDGASQDKESDFEFKTFGRDCMNGFW